MYHLDYQQITVDEKAYRKYIEMLRIYTLKYLQKYAVQLNTSDLNTKKK